MTVGRSPHDDRKPRSSTAYRNIATPNSSPSPGSSSNTSPSRSARVIDTSEAAIASASTLPRLPRPPHSYSSSAASSDNDNGDERRADSARGSAITYTASTATGGVNVTTTGSDAGAGLAAVASSSVATDYWKDDLSNLLTPQTVVEQAQVQRRKRNREAARRSRLKQKERERELVERQAQLSDRLNFLKQELVEWRMMNANAPNRLINVTAVADIADSQLPLSLQPSTSQPQQQQLLQLIDPALVLGTGNEDLVDNINKVYVLILQTLHIIGDLQLQLDDITKELNEILGSSS
ncbi:hypothetical protein GGI19_001702 [Coemansia pectinata]|uniref:BZIP domain-containing protein n=1 Tax=Coemansia pectinata TaxID=1052879 RepID=A0A9W8GYI3_9FUNG|nr:hypothetical protein GGI19_001702 [Coemansia pectinata]